MSTPLTNLTATEAVEKLKSGEISAVDLANDYLTEIEAKNPDLNAFLEVFDDVLDQARKLDQVGAKDKTLAGLPIAIKDNILIRGRTVSSASKILENYTATYDATVIGRLKDAGVVFLGRTNMDEFAMGGSTENSAFGPTKNPHDKGRVAGGSSGGSAAVVGGGLAPWSLGSDTGGSIRQPASFCGAVGLKPTYGTVSRYGLMAMASSLDQIGPIAKTVADTKLLFEVIAGIDELDSTSVARPASQDLPDQMVIGVPTDFLQKGVDSEVSANFDQTIKMLESRGYQVREVSLPNLKYALACYYILMPAEASSNLARFDGVKYGLKVNGEDLLGDYLKTRHQGFGPEVRRRILLGTYVLSAGYYDAYYAKATGIRNLIRRDYDQVFDSGVHAILTPTTPSPAFKLGEKTSDPLQMYLEDIFTVPVNLAGLPAMSVPSGSSQAGLPLGVQITAPHFAEDVLFALGQEIESGRVDQ